MAYNGDFHQDLYRLLGKYKVIGDTTFGLGYKEAEELINNILNMFKDLPSGQTHFSPAAEEAARLLEDVKKGRYGIIYISKNSEEFVSRLEKIIKLAYDTI